MDLQLKCQSGPRPHDRQDVAAEGMIVFARHATPTFLPALPALSRPKTARSRSSRISRQPTARRTSPMQLAEGKIAVRDFGEPQDISWTLP
jgi:hypothetical protein